MRAISRLVLVAALLIGFAPVAVSAQAWKADIGINGGASWYSEMLDDEVAGPEGARFDAGWLTGAQITFWPRERMGIRANGTYSYRPIKADGGDDAGEDSNTLHDDINLWSGSVDLLFRLRSPNESWMGRETLPYIALGLGAKWVNPSGDYESCVDAEEDKSWSCATIFPTTGPIAVGEQKVIMGLVGLGADFRLSPRSALRLEINDRIYRPQVYDANPTNTNDTEGMRIVNLPQGDEIVANVMHEVGAQLGFHLLMGLRTPPPVVVAPPPPPPPARPPAPPAQPTPPREDNISVCVIDPTAPNGIRMQNAIYRVEQRDTLVMVNGNRVPLRQSVGNVMVARNAGWYVGGQPLVITVGNQNMQYLTYGGARQVDAGSVTYLGTVNGYPVYADRDEVADVTTALNTARGANQGRDLGAILAENATIRDSLEDVQYLYVPLDATGCVFQPVQMMEAVTKGGK